MFAPRDNQIHRCGRKGAHIARKCLWIGRGQPVVTTRWTRCQRQRYESRRRLHIRIQCDLSKGQNSPGIVAIWKTTTIFRRRYYLPVSHNSSTLLHLRKLSRGLTGASWRSLVINGHPVDSVLICTILSLLPSTATLTNFFFRALWRFRARKRERVGETHALNKFRLLRGCREIGGSRLFHISRNFGKYKV